MMARLWKPENVSFWHLIPVALVLHGLLLRAPIALDEPKEKPQTAPVKMQKLSPSKIAATPKPSSSPLPPTAIVPPAPITSSSSQTVAQPVVPAAVQQPVSQPIQPAQPVAPVQPATPPIQATPPVIPPKTPDIFQLQGATECASVKDCYASTETNGRSIAQTLEQKLQSQGYALQPIDLDEDTGMKVYHLFQNGQPKDYLHIIWTDKGTRSLRLPQPEKNWQQLALKAKL